MGQPVVHFEVMGKDGEKLQRFYADLFGWEINTDNPMNYGVIQREGNTDAQGAGIGGGVAASDQGQSYVTFYVATDDVEAALQKAEELGGSRMMGPTDVMEGIQIGLFNDPEGHMIGVVRAEQS